MIAAALLLLACHDDVTEPSVVETSPSTPLEGPALLRRISLDLRGVVPSIDELDRYEASPDSLDEIVDDYLRDPHFEDRMVDLLAEHWLMRVDEFNVPASDFGLEDDEFGFLRSVSDEPLRLMASIAANDLPWTDIVTADYTMANDTLTEMWPLSYIDPEAEGDWKPARYEDGRPAGGVIMTNGLWWRYTSTLNNVNRGRAAAMSKLLLCYDFLTRPVAFSGFPSFTSEALLAATKETPSCEACHSGLDPLAATLFGFYWFDTKDATEMSTYHTDRELLGTFTLDLEPTYFGTPIAGAVELGPRIAADPRFSTCAVQTFATALWRRTPDEMDFATLTELDTAFEEGGLRVSTLLKGIVLTDAYRAGALSDEATDDDDDRVRTRRLLSVEQLSSAVEDLTGYSWFYEGFDQLGSDTTGYRVMAGGVDGSVVRTPSFEPTVTRSLVMRRLAQAAAYTVVSADFAAAPDARRLFPAEVADLAALEPGSVEFDATLTHLHRRIHGLSADDELRAAETSLWQQIDTVAGPEQAWMSVVSLLLRDPLFWSD